MSNQSMDTPSGDGRDFKANRPPDSNFEVPVERMTDEEMQSIEDRLNEWRMRDEVARRMKKVPGGYEMPMPKEGNAAETKDEAELAPDVKRYNAEIRIRQGEKRQAARDANQERARVQREAKQAQETALQNVMMKLHPDNGGEGVEEAFAGLDVYLDKLNTGQLDVLADVWERNAERLGLVGKGHAIEDRLKRHAERKASLERQHVKFFTPEQMAGLRDETERDIDKELAGMDFGERQEIPLEDIRALRRQMEAEAAAELVEPKEPKKPSGGFWGAVKNFFG